MQKVIYLLSYLFLAIVLPGVVLVKTIGKKLTVDIPGYLTLYIIFIAPFFFIIPYKLAKLKNKKEKIYFVVFGLIIPFTLIYFYLFLDFKKNFHPGF